MTGAARFGGQKAKTTGWPCLSRQVMPEQSLFPVWHGQDLDRARGVAGLAPIFLRARLQTGVSFMRKEVPAKAVFDPWVTGRHFPQYANTQWGLPTILKNDQGEPT
jgi:hypothetical protein